MRWGLVLYSVVYISCGVFKLSREDCSLRSPADAADGLADKGLSERVRAAACSRDYRNYWIRWDYGI